MAASATVIAEGRPILPAALSAPVRRATWPAMATVAHQPLTEPSVDAGKRLHYIHSMGDHDALTISTPSLTRIYAQGYTYIRSGLHVYTLRLTHIYAQAYAYIRAGVREGSFQRVATGRVGVKEWSDEIGCLKGGMKKLYE